MTDVLTPGTDRVLRWFTAGRDARATDDATATVDAVVDEMAAHAEATDYPIVGPEVGRLLEVLTRTAGVERAFEFGSGFGYSAAWVARALPAGGEVVLTDLEADHLDRARAWLDEAGLGERIRVVPGDAHEAIEDEPTSLDLVVLDHYNRRYVEALEAVRDRLRPGGLLVADNALAGNSVFLDDLVAHVDGEAVETNENTAGTIAYHEALQADPDFETTLLPVGDGVSVSVRLG